MEDKTLSCQDCGEEFIFSARAQKFYAKMEYDDPIRCHKCRIAKKMRFNEFRNEVRSKKFNKPDKEI